MGSEHHQAGRGPDHRHGHHDHGHSGGHSHGAHHHAPKDFGRAFVIGIALNLAYVIAEAYWGVAADSLSLLADAGHNLSDVLALGAAWLAAVLSRRPPSAKFTYGLRGSSILAALGNAVALLLVTGGIAWQAVLRLMDPQPIEGRTMIVVAAAGVLVNAATALLFVRGRKDDLNIRGAFLHMASDALVSLGVVAGGVLILLTGWIWVDPALSIAISLVIIAGTWSLLRDSLDLSLNAVPAGIDRDQVIAYLRALPNVTDVHDLHIWGMSTTENALTVHLVRPNAAIDDELTKRVCDELRQKFRIHHATIQVEDGRGERECDLRPSHIV